MKNITIGSTVNALAGFCVIIGIIIFGIVLNSNTQSDIRKTQAIQQCEWNVFVAYQTELAKRCGAHHLPAVCQLPEGETQTFNWQNNMSDPTLACENE